MRTCGVHCIILRKFLIQFAFDSEWWLLEVAGIQIENEDGTFAAILKSEHNPFREKR